jgi:hypothetical protein
MKAEFCAPIRVVSVGALVTLLMVAPARPARAQANSTEIPSASGATANAPSGGETGQPNETGGTATHHKGAHAHPQAKKKKPSFFHKMRDKAMDKFQKYLAKKQEPKQEPEHPKTEPKQIPQKDIE